jgi:hypothetical protein
MSDDGAASAIARLPRKLLTEPEVAERLRCSTSKIKRIRQAGLLAYIPGRPLLIDEADLIDCINRLKTTLKRPTAEAAPVPTRSHDEAVSDARAWALAQRAKDQRRAAKKSKAT